MVHLGTWAVSVVEREEGDLPLRVKGVHFVAARSAAIAKELVSRKTGSRESNCIAVLIRMDSTPMSDQYWKRHQTLEVYVGPMEIFGPVPKIVCKSCGGHGKQPGDPFPGLSCGPCGGTGLQRVR